MNDGRIDGLGGSRLSVPATLPPLEVGHAPGLGQRRLTQTSEPARRSHLADGVATHPSDSSSIDARATLSRQSSVAPRAEVLRQWQADVAGLPRNQPIAPGDQRGPLLQGVGHGDQARMKQLLDLRRGAVIVPGAPVPHDPTEDPIEQTVMSAEMGAGVADLGIAGFQSAVGKLSAAGQGSELVSSLIGMLPSVLTLVAQRRLIIQGQSDQQAESRLQQSIRQQTNRLQTLLGGDPPDPGQPPDFEALRTLLQNDPAGQLAGVPDELRGTLGRAVDVLERLHAGQAVSETYLADSIKELKKGQFFTYLSLTGAATGTTGAVLTTVAEVAEQSVPQVLGTVGYAAGAAGSVIALPFTAMFMWANYRAITPHATAAQNAQTLLKETAAEKDRSLAPTTRPGFLRRALAQLAERRAEPGGKRFKTGMFGLAISAGLVNIATGVTAALAVGAAATLAAVATGIGVAALVGFAGYTIYKAYQSRKADGAYRPADLKKVITGEPNLLSGPIKTRQTEKLLNRAMIASCEQALHERVDAFYAAGAAGAGPAGRRNFKQDVIDGLREHARGILLNDQSIAGGVERERCAAMAERIVAACTKVVSIDHTGRLTAVKGRDLETQIALPGGGPARGQAPRLAEALKKAFTEALATELRAANRAGVSLVPSRSGFSAALNRTVVPGLVSSRHQVSQANRAAVAAALAGQLPQPSSLQGWEDSADAGIELHQLIDDQAAELAQAAALRKLMRRDPEALLLAFVRTLRDLDRSGDTDTRDQMRQDLLDFGVTEATLKQVVQAEDDVQISAAVGLVSRELSFLS